MGNFVESQRTINAQLSQKIDTMENNVNKRNDGLQSEMEQKLDNLQYSISKLANQLVHQGEDNPKALSSLPSRFLIHWEWIPAAKIGQHKNNTEMIPQHCFFFLFIKLAENDSEI